MVVEGMNMGKDWFTVSQKRKTGPLFFSEKKSRTPTHCSGCSPAELGWGLGPHLRGP